MRHSWSYSCSGYILYVRTMENFSRSQKEWDATARAPPHSCPRCMFGPPAGLFLFAGTSTPSIHWIAPTIGIVVYAGSVFIILQCIFMYVPMSYPKVSLYVYALKMACQPLADTPLVCCLSLRWKRFLSFRDRLCLDYVRTATVS
jgi:hypothetical protein